jgi:cell division protein FtsW
VKKSPLLPLIFGLITIGLVFIAISSLTEANSTIGDKYFFLKKQSIWLGISLVAFCVISKIKLETVKKLSFPLYIASLITLALVLLPGLGNQALGAQRWLNLGFASIQPSEILKFTSIVYFSYLFANPEKRTIKHLIFYLSIPFLLIILEPNLSTAMLVSAIVISIYYLSGGEIMSLFTLCVTVVFLSFILVLVSPYRSARLKSLLNPNSNQNTASYHTNQIILALSSGGVFGKGFANSDQKYRFLPKISTDSILAVIGEEVGFFGVVLIFLMYIYLITYLIRIAQIIPDPFPSLLVSSVACWIAYQSLINIAAIVAIIPLTGVPLPFISYGGSSLLTLFSAIGLVRNIEKQYYLLIYSNSDSKALDKENHHHRHSPDTRRRANQSTESRR